MTPAVGIASHITEPHIESSIRKYETCVKEFMGMASELWTVWLISYLRLASESRHVMAIRVLRLAQPNENL